MEEYPEENKCAKCPKEFCLNRIIKSLSDSALEEFHSFCERIEESVKEGRKIYA